MPLFDYEVVDRVGTLGRGRAEADDLGELARRLRGQEQVVVSIRPAGARWVEGVNVGPILEAFKESLSRMASGVKLATLVLFTGQLAAMLGGGIHLVRSLGVLAAETTDKHFGKVLERVRLTITGGSTFADALGEHPHIFNSLYVSIVRAGELSGSLPLVLNTLTIYLEKADQLRRKIRGALAYPAVIMTSALLIVTVMIVKIVPVFEGVYARANTKLPAPTLMLLAVSNILRSYAVMIVLALILLGLVLFMALRTPRGQHLLDAFKLRVPLFGPLIRKAILARVCRTLSVLLQSGVPFLEAMHTVAQAAQNRVMEKALLAAAQGVREGGTIAEALRHAGEFPGMVTQLVTAGEESGTLPVMLGKAAVYYEQEVDNSVATLSSLIQPIMIVIVGGITAGIIIAIYLPIFNLGQAVRRMR